MRASRLRWILGAAVAACLVTAPVAGAQKLGWNEKAKFGGKPVMSYTVESLTFGKSSWTARVSFRNLSTHSIRVGSEFGVGFWTKGNVTDLTRAVGLATATRYSSKPPATLKPGQSWSGVIGGDGRLARTSRVYARVIFGPFADFPGHATPVVWITDHATALNAKKHKSSPPIPGPAI
jgi:hypothetical protein